MGFYGLPLVTVGYRDSKNPIMGIFLEWVVLEFLCFLWLGDHLEEGFGRKLFFFRAKIWRNGRCFFWLEGKPYEPP